ncbi:MAG: NlpC/P60 family protein [Actinomycetota bacterium]|nr:NlpC/P60 family protein [Actinomycetota bacterium]
MSNLQAQAAALAAKLNSLGNQEEALAERYDQAQYQLGNLEGQVSAAQKSLAAAQARTDQARQALKADAINAYVNGGNTQPTGGGDAMQSATESLLRAEYVNTLATSQSEAIDRFHLATLQEQTAADNLKRQESAAQAQVASLASARQAVSHSQAQLTATQGQISQEIAQLQAEEAAARQAAAQAAAARQAAAQAAAEAQARALAAEAAQLQAADPAAGSQGGGGSQPANTVSTVINNPPPPAGSGEAGALAAAETRIGDWYQWGASGPSTFDCSGLVMWAYAQVGISLPHYSGAQYADTTHIPMSDLQPGDLVFFSDPGEHVAIYVGNGEIIEAPHTGAQVHIVAMYSGFTLASRVA